jgi:hypothetical protein
MCGYVNELYGDISNASVDAVDFEPAKIVTVKRGRETSST